MSRNGVVVSKKLKKFEGIEVAVWPHHIPNIEGCRVLAGLARKAAAR